MTRTRKITPCIYVSLEDMRTGMPLVRKGEGIQAGNERRRQREHQRRESRFKCASTGGFWSQG